MAIYLVSGRLGSGKTLASVGRIRDALNAGKRVATNLDLKLEKLLHPKAGKAKDGIQTLSVVRLPDKPTVGDLEDLGCGNESMDESRNGLIVLDELAAWLNARSWADKSRQAVIDWLIHSRKLGWDVIFIAQHPDQIDKQIRNSLVEYLAVCRRLDRLRIPFVGGLIRFLSGGLITGLMPRVHVATVKYGTDQNAIVADRWVYRGVELYEGYDTRQVFRTGEITDKCHASAAPPVGSHSYLAPWLVSGRYLAPDAALLDRLRVWWAGPPPPSPKPRHRLVKLLSGLPADQALRHWHRLNSLDAFA